MKLLFLTLLLPVLALAQAVEAPGILSPGAERQRIQVERDQAQAHFANDEVACYQKFAVNDCLGKARMIRREALADLRRQEVLLNATEAKQKAAAQIARIEEKSSLKAQNDEAARRLASEQSQAERQRVFDEKAAESAARRLKAAP